MTVYVGSGYHTSSPTYKNPCIDITSFFCSKYRKITCIIALTPIGENGKPS